MLLVFTGTGLIAQDFAYSEHLMQKFNSAQQRAAQKNSSSTDYLWLTPLLNEARQNKEKLTQKARDFFKDYEERPVFEGTEQILRLGNFAFHYTIDGPVGERVDSTDTDGNSIPDYVDFMTSAFVDDIYDMYHTISGYTIPPADGTAGGDALYDVYISANAAPDFVYGFVAGETEIGDNLNSTHIIERDAYTSFMVMRSNYDGFPSQEDIAIKVTAAHEYMHAVQFGVSTSMGDWFYEATAAWAEDYVYPGLDDNFQYLDYFFTNPDVSLNLNNDEDPDFDGHWYGSWIFFRYITEHFGNDIIRRVYDKCVLYDAIPALDYELIEFHNTTFREEFKNYIVANIVMQSDAAYAPYTYDRADDYATYINALEDKELIEYVFDYDGTNIAFNSKIGGNDRLMRLSADYFKVNTNDDFKIVLKTQQYEYGLEFMLVKLNMATSTFEVQHAAYNAFEQVINVTDFANWEQFIPVVIRHDVQVGDIDPIDYEIFITEAAYLSVAEKDIAKAIKVYPNPANDYLTIEMSNMDNNSIIEIYAASGQLVKTFAHQANKLISIADLPKGIYTIKAIENTNHVSFNKVILTR